MKRFLLPFLAAVSLACAFASASLASERPRYGGTLRVQVRENLFSIDPSDSKSLSGTKSKIATLIFDRLTRIDAKGAVLGQLAESWSSDPQAHVWQFHLHRGIKFHDGSVLSPAVVASAVASPHWRAKAGPGGDTVTIECESPVPNLPAVLASARYSVVQHNPDGSFSGTGPFQITAWEPGHRLLLSANDDYFAGRPYVDSVEIQMGNSLREQLIDLRLDHDDMIEVGLDQSRKLTQASQRVSNSLPSDLLALVFVKDMRNSHSVSGDQGTTRNAQVVADDLPIRELLARSISTNRDAINSIILQKQGTAAAGLLAQWLSGYEFLLNTGADAERMNKLRAGIGKTRSFYLAYDAGDPISKSIAERISVNARDVGLLVQAFGEKNVSLTSSSNADAILLRISAESANATQALTEIASTVHMDGTTALTASTPEQLFAAEGALLNEYKLVPIVHVPQSLWISSRVKNWNPGPTGGWNLDDLWLGPQR